MSNVEPLRRKATDTRPGEQSKNELDGQYYRRDQTTLPTADNSWNLGSAAARLANIYSVWFRGTSTSALYADLAEMYRSDMELEAGDVVCIGGAEEITKSQHFMCKDVFGVISTAPGFLMNDKEEESSTHYPVVMSGRAPCKVKGKVSKGDRLVTSDEEGYAIAIGLNKLDSVSPHCIIGRALEDKLSDGKGIVEAVLGKL
jgi:hypothetical protein